MKAEQPILYERNDARAPNIEDQDYTSIDNDEQGTLPPWRCIRRVVLKYQALYYSASNKTTGSVSCLPCLDCY